MDGDRRDVELGETRPERIEVPRRRGAALPGRRVVDEDLDRPGADLAGTFRGPPKALAERKVDPDARPIGGQCGPERRGGPPFVYSPPIMGSIIP